MTKKKLELPGTATDPGPESINPGVAIPPDVGVPMAAEVHDHGLVVADLKRLIDEEAAKQHLVEDFVLKEMRPGEDYGTVHRKLGRGPGARPCPRRDEHTLGRCQDCGATAELWLPGAERVVKRLGCRWSEPEVAKDLMDAIRMEAPWISIRIQILSRGGEVLGHGLGAQTLAERDGDPNATMKMAAKSAMIDAAKRTFALSRFFAQDVPREAEHDNTKRGAPPGDSPPSAPAGSTPAGSASGAPANAAHAGAVLPATQAGAVLVETLASLEAKVDSWRKRLGVRWETIYALAECAGVPTDERGIHRPAPGHWVLVLSWFKTDLTPKLLGRRPGDPEVTKITYEWIAECRRIAFGEAGRDQR